MQDAGIIDDDLIAVEDGWPETYAYAQSRLKTLKDEIEHGIKPSLLRFGGRRVGNYSVETRASQVANVLQGTEQNGKTET